MNMKEVKDLIREILQSDIAEFELEHTGTKVRIKRQLQGPAVPAVEQPTRAPAPAPTPSAAPAEEATGEEKTDSKLHFITSPIVGTFYRSPSPDSAPFIEIGERVQEGSILCIVEAMKLMNEIPSDINGVVAEIYIENSHPVEFGQKLFGIRPE